MQGQRVTDTEVQIVPKGADKPITLSGDLTALHDNPHKIHQLLDVLDMPAGTEVHVITKASSVIVR
jgi:hypothetical protein